jgi:hypothetical protein
MSFDNLFRSSHLLPKPLRIEDVGKVVDWYKECLLGVRICFPSPDPSADLVTIGWMALLLHND